MEQFELNFEAGLLDQFPTFGDVLRASVYGNAARKPFKAIAMDLEDVSPSKLSRMLSEADTGINFPAHRLDELVAATGDMRPVYWLVEKFCVDADQQRRQAVGQLMEMLPKLDRALRAAGVEPDDDNGGGQ